MIFDFEKGFNDSESLSIDERPVIGISANIINSNSALHFAYSQAIIDAGGVPLIIPGNSNAQTLNAIVKCIDGVLFSGGDDIDARFFGEENIEGLTEVNLERDNCEFILLRIAIDCGIPIFGICRGTQLINIALGGTLYQDLPSMYPKKLVTHSVLTDKHLGVHDVEVAKDSKLFSIIEKTNISVNSRHHQAIKEVAPTLKVTAYAPDGVVEAIEAYPNLKIFGVQWHPENMAAEGNNNDIKKLFNFFVSEANLYRKAKRIHILNPIIDSHCDTPMLYDSHGFDFFIRNKKSKVDVVKMTEGYVDTTITVAYISQKTPKEVATDKALNILARFKTDISKISDKIIVAYTLEDVLRAKKRGLKSVMLGVENGLAIGDELSNIDKFKKAGTTYITLCHNGANDICDSAIGLKIHNGVSFFGKKVIEYMNKLGITVDISHSSEKSTYDALEISSYPIIASHSSCKALCNHPRNLSDNAIKAIAEKGGVVQVCGYDGFLTKDSKATIHDLITHIEHIINLTGYNHVGVGSDFDGGGGVVGFDGANEFMNITIELLRRGHSPINIAQIMGGNILRVLSNNMH